MLDWGNVNGQINKFKKSYALTKNSEAFCYVVLDQILKISGTEISDAITDGGDDRGIDAVYIDERLGVNTIHLFQFKHHSKYESSNKNFPSNEIDKIISFLKDLLNRSENLSENCNNALFSKVNDIWAALDSSAYKFTVHLVSNGKGLKDNQYDRFITSISKYKTVAIEQHTLSSLSHDLTGVKIVVNEKKLHLVDEQIFERTDGIVRGLTGTIKAASLIDLISEDDNRNRINSNIFEENVRLYLGEKNEINKKIYETALSEHNSEFWYMNNGITIVCESYQYQPGLSSPVITMVKPQIVNGGQTSYSLFEAYKMDKLRVVNVKVLVRIIETKNPGLTYKIAEATNSQTPIRSRDLRSNDEVQIKIESILLSHGYFYERKRNKYIDKVANKRIDSLNLGQWIWAYYHKEPDRSKSQSDRIFGEMYELIFDPQYLSDEYILTAIKLYQEIEERKILAKKKLKNRLSGSYDEAWIIEGMYHVMFMVCVLCEQRGVEPCNFEEAVKLIPDAMQRVSNFVKAQKNASAYRIFRAASTKNILRSINPPEQLSLSLND